MKRPPPQHRLRIIQISFHQDSLFILGVGQMHHRHLPPQAHQNIVLRVNHAPGGIQDDRCTAQVFLKPALFSFLTAEKFVHHSYFFSQIFRFPLPISHTVRPPHPRGHAVDSRVPARRQPPPAPPASSQSGHRSTPTATPPPLTSWSRNFCRFQTYPLAPGGSAFLYAFRCSSIISYLNVNADYARARWAQRIFRALKYSQMLWQKAAIIP